MIHIGVAIGIGIGASACVFIAIKKGADIYYKVRELVQNVGSSDLFRRKNEEDTESSNDESHVLGKTDEDKLIEISVVSNSKSPQDKKNIAVDYVTDNAESSSNTLKNVNPIIFSTTLCKSEIENKENCNKNIRVSCKWSTTLMMD